jgi:predicted  nucleic acid-binding Zn-ribbon protein
MSLQVCSDCGAAYAPAAQCPQCGGGVFRFSWEEEEMAKATVGGGGSSNAGDLVVEGGTVEDGNYPYADEAPAAPVKRGPGRPRKATTAAASGAGSDTTE